MDHQRRRDVDAAGDVVALHRPQDKDSGATAARFRTLSAYDPALPTGEFSALTGLVDDALAPRRLITGMLGGFSTMALILAALGLYGVIAHGVTQRTQEIGLRIAIGAGRGDVLGPVVGDGLRLVGYGIAVGLVGTALLTRVLQSLLFGVSAYDPLVFIGNAGLLTLVAIAACAWPAHRAARVNPTIALRGA